jgi:hypothetical protein
MRSLAANMFLTLEGVYQGPGGPSEDPSGDFTYGGWSVNYWYDIMGQRMGPHRRTTRHLQLRHPPP